MDALTAAVYARLNGDTELTTTKGVITTQGRLNQDPKLLQRPHLVFKVDGAPTLPGYHGAATSTRIEMKIWGYEGNRLARGPACLAAAVRVSNLMLPAFTYLEVPGGGSTRPGEDPGWQQVEDTDPLTIHLHNVFIMHYWSAQRVAALAS